MQEQEQEHRTSGNMCGTGSGWSEPCTLPRASTKPRYMHTLAHVAMKSPRLTQWHRGTCKHEIQPRLLEGATRIPVAEFTWPGMMRAGFCPWPEKYLQAAVRSNFVSLILGPKMSPET